MRFLGSAYAQSCRIIDTHLRYNFEGICVINANLVYSEEALLGQTTEYSSSGFKIGRYFGSAKGARRDVDDFNSWKSAHLKRSNGRVVDT